MAILSKSEFIDEVNISDYKLEKVMKKLGLEFVDHPTDDRSIWVSNEAQEKIRDHLWIK